MNKELAKLMNDVFNQDMNEMLLWLNKPNTNFGGSTPQKLIDSGRIDKVKAFLQATLKGY